MANYLVLWSKRVGVQAAAFALAVVMVDAAAAQTGADGDHSRRAEAKIPARAVSDGTSESSLSAHRRVEANVPAQTGARLSLERAIALALQQQASVFRQAELNERIAAEDLQQSRLALLPRLQAAPTVIYTSPLGGRANAGPSFIAANAVAEYQLLFATSGEVDLSGRLRANLRRSRALLTAARAGTAAARRELVLATTEAYYQLALAAARRRAAERNLSTAEEFERITELLLSGGEVASVDLTRARIQTAARREELERAQTDETVATTVLRTLIGDDAAQPIAVDDLLAAAPREDEIERYVAELVRQRPELAQLEAERRAALEEAKLARAERRPQLTYSFGGGSDAGSLFHLGRNAGVTATVGIAIPIFDWGTSRSRERQATLRAQLAESTLALARRRFGQEFEAARAQALAAIRRARLAGENIKAAERNLQTSIARYRAGEASIIEVTDAQTTLVAQQTALQQAIYDYQVARARLVRATGQ